MIFCERLKPPPHPTPTNVVLINLLRMHIPTYTIRVKRFYNFYCSECLVPVFILLPHCLLPDTDQSFWVLMDSKAPYWSWWIPLKMMDPEWLWWNLAKKCLFFHLYKFDQIPFLIWLGMHQIVAVFTHCNYIPDRFPSKVIFHERLSSNKRSLSLKVRFTSKLVFHQKLSSIMKMYFRLKNSKSTLISFIIYRPPELRQRSSWQ